MGIAARCVHGAGLCVVPNERNDYRPLALRHAPLFVVSALLLSAKILTLMVIAVTPATAELSTITSSRITQLTNAERTKAGLKPLTENSLLASAAKQKAQHMLTEDYFAHISPSGVTPWFWMSKVGYTYQVAGENLAIDFTEAEDVVAAWLASPTHKENMLFPTYTETGIAVATGEFQGSTSTVVVHMFGLPSGAQAPTTEPAAPTATPAPAVKSEQTAPVATPAPTLPPDTTPPRVPRIAVVGNTSTIQEQLTLEILGEPGSTVHVLVNGQERTSTLLRDAETTLELATGTVPDGTVIIRAFASDALQNQSALSSPLSLTKDTQGPALAREELSFVLSPATDKPLALLQTVEGIADRIRVDLGTDASEHASGTMIPVALAHENLSVAFLDEFGNTGATYEFTLSPQFRQDDEQSFLTPLARFSRATRWLAGSFFVIILGLLSMAILIRVQIQRPSLISHASFVLLLAMVLFLV